MRELKFRAWNDEKYIYAQNRFVYTDDYDKNDVDRYEDIGHFFATRDNIEQYTGLKDKNGTEIYEGDIIQTQYMNAKGWVVWANGAWDIRLLKDTFVELFLAEEVGVGCEVIGNIHENPELLGG